jgi:hypothetical protein
MYFAGLDGVYPANAGARVDSWWGRRFRLPAIFLTRSHVRSNVLAGQPQPVKTREKTNSRRLTPMNADENKMLIGVHQRPIGAFFTAS